MQDMTWKECWEEFIGFWKCVFGNHDWVRRSNGRIAVCGRNQCNAKRLYPGP